MIRAKRAWKPVAGAALAGTFLFYSLMLGSCRKFDPREYAIGKLAVEDTVVPGKAAFKEIGERALGDGKPAAGALFSDTVKIMAPLKEKALVAAPGSE